MSLNIPTPENLKEKAKVVRTFMKEKCGVEISHSHCLELLSQVFGFKDWNTTAAILKTNNKQEALPIHIKTVGDLKRALEHFEDSDFIDADYEFKAKEYLDELGMEDFGSEDLIHQEFSFVLSRPRDSFGIASLDLKLEHESMTMF